MRERMTHIHTIPLSSITRPRERGSEAVRWPLPAVEALFALPFADLLHRAQQIHRQHFDANELQLSTLLSIKTGGCSQEFGDLAPSPHFDTAGLGSQPIETDAVSNHASTVPAISAALPFLGADRRRSTPRGH